MKYNCNPKPKLGTFVFKSGSHMLKGKNRTNEKEAKGKGGNKRITENYNLLDISHKSPHRGIRRECAEIKHRRGSMVLEEIYQKPRKLSHAE